MKTILGLFLLKFMAEVFVLLTDLLRRLLGQPTAVTVFHAYAHKIEVTSQKHEFGQSSLYLMRITWAI